MSSPTGCARKCCLNVLEEEISNSQDFVNATNIFKLITMSSATGCARKCSLLKSHGEFYKLCIIFFMILKMLPRIFLFSYLAQSLKSFIDGF